jgi:NAD(P)H-hydrate epimerase
MENAGRGVADVLEKRNLFLSSCHTYVVCGKGNNGGDGFVIARHLLDRAAMVHVFLLGRIRDVKGDARTNLRILLRLLSANTERLSFQELSERSRFPAVKSPAIVVDAIFGTGFSGEVTGLYKRAIEWVNRSSAYVVAVDIPSGVQGTTGSVSTTAIRANLTVTMALGKIGHYIGRGRDHTGELATTDIGIPKSILRSFRDQAYLVEKVDVRRMLPTRPLSAHKHSVGKVFVLAGSRGLTGAPFMCAQSVMKAGAGAVVLGVPRSLHLLLARKVTEVMVTPLEETTEGTIAHSAMKAIQEHIDWADVVVLGPGLSRQSETRKLLLHLLPMIDKKLVLDADGLYVVEQVKRFLRKRRRPAILTPHVGELSRITGEKGESIEEFRVSMARKFSKEFNSVLVLKGAPTVTGVPAGVTYLNSTGNPGMATAGSGDVLTGLISGLLGQGMSEEDAAVSGVYLHGLAGDKAAMRVGQKSMLALDILDFIPEAFKSIEM